MRCRLVVILVLIEGLAWADDRAGDPLAQARKSVAASSYAVARSQLAAALDAGDHGPDEMVELYRLSGIVEAALEDPRAATAAFTRLLALSPRATLPAGTSPKITRPFDAAARYFETHAPLEVKIETRAVPPAITLVMTDSLGMVAQARIAFTIDGGAEQIRDAVASARTVVALPTARRLDARAFALDGHGNRLVEIGSKEVPIVIIGEPPPPAAAARPPGGPAPVDVAAPATGPAVAPGDVVDTNPAPSQPLYLRWWPYAAVAAGFGGATAYFAWSTRSDSRELGRLNAASASYTFTEYRALAKPIEDRGRRDALLTNIGLGVSGAFAIAAGALFVMSPGGSEPHVVAVPVRGGGAIVWNGAF
jgi:hypothetical protein